MNVTEKQRRFEELTAFLHKLYDKIPESNFVYLWTKQGKETFPFALPAKISLMAQKAIALADSGVDVYHSVNPINIEPTSGKRGDELSVSYQTAIVIDIDIRSDAHKGDADKFPSNFEEAKSFLPFEPSILIFSGYGLHAYYIFDEPLAITDINRDEIKQRNGRLIELVRLRAGLFKKSIDSIGDLPRILRTPSTFNYKLGADHAPMCHIVENSGLRFSPAQIDEKLNVSVTITSPSEIQAKVATSLAGKNYFDFSDDDPDLKEFRIRRMLDFINPSTLTYDDWLAVGMALKNIGCDCSLWEQWSRSDERFKDGECQYKWNGFNREGYEIGTLFHLAQLGGYDAKDTFREWKTLQNAARGAKLEPARKPSSHGRHSQPRKEFSSMNNDNKGSPQIQGVNDPSTQKIIDTPHPPFTPVNEREYDSDADKIVLPILELPPYMKKDGIEFYSATQVARILHVGRTTVLHWRKKGLFVEDFVKHNVFLYSRERVEQLKSVYHKSWTWGGYLPSPTTSEPKSIDTQFAPNNEEPASKIDSLNTELQSVKKALSDFDKEKSAALEKLRNIETFDSNTMFSKDIIIAAAFAKLFDKQAFSNLKREIRNYGDKNRSEKVSVNDWNSDIKDKAEEILSRQNLLLNRRTEIKAEINSLSFAISNDVAQNITFPKGYSISSENGIEKVAGESMITICRRPIIITGKTFSVDERIYKVTLAYMTPDGKWKKLAPTEKAVVFNHRKLVDLANADLPVTSQNAAGLVEYFDAFATANEINFPLEYSVPRCGWYTFDGRDYFIDPRCLCSITNENKKINVVVDSLSLFAQALRKKGNIEAWKKIYKLVKKSPVARTMIATAIAPILLKILGERNFLLYVCAPTRAGKTTALYLAASAVGSEKMIRSFDATKNGLAGAAADVNDFVFLVDEKQVADSKLKEQFDTLVYALANGLGRTKLNKDSTLRKLQDWRTIAIMTGETQLLADNVTGGANTRLLSINVAKEILSADTCRIIHETIKDNHGLVFPLVIDKIFQLGFDMLRETYQKLVALFTTKYPELLNEYCRYMAVLTLADSLLNSVLTNDSVLPLDDSIQNSIAIFKLLPTNAEISDTTRERNFVLAIIAQNQNRFIGGNVPLDRMQAICGKLNDNDGHTYISAKFLQDECNHNGFDYHKLVSDLIEDGFFIPSDTTEKGRKNPLSTVNKKLGKACTRCYKLSTQTLNEGE